MLRVKLLTAVAGAVFLFDGCGNSGAPTPGLTAPAAAANATGAAPINRLTVERFNASESGPGATGGPRRTTLHNMTMESLDGPRYAWNVIVPAHASFDADIALDAEKGALPDGATATFALAASAGDAAPVTLLEKTITANEKGWNEFHVDLDDYAGKSARFILSSRQGPADKAVRAVWGNPTIAMRDTRMGTPVILISCDTTRADHLGCYGYGRDTSPNIDAFSKEAVLFEEAVTPETWTLAAHMSMLTGLLPMHHGVMARTTLAERVVTLPDALRDAGYATGGFTGYSIWLNPARGFAHGFDRYSTPPLTRSIFKTLEFAGPWLDAHAHAPFFLFFHNYDLHSKYKESNCDGCDLPYYPPRAKYLRFAKELPEPASLRAPGRARSSDLLFAVLQGRDSLTPEELRFAIALYDDAISGVDSGVAELLDKLKALGVYDDSLIVITADHGESFGEHGQFMHEHLYESSARVPLLIRFPHAQFAGKRVTDMVQLTDIAPTILDALSLPIPPMDGESLLPVVRGEKKPNPVARIHRLKHYAVRTPVWKLIGSRDTTGEELYNIAADPNELTNVLDTSPPELEMLRSELHAFVHESPQPAGGGEPPPLTPEEIDAIKGLGYAGDIE